MGSLSTKRAHKSFRMEELIRAGRIVTLGKGGGVFLIICGNCICYFKDN